MTVKNGAGVASVPADHDARKIAVLVGAQDEQASKPNSRSAQVYTLHRGTTRHSRDLVRVIPCEALPPLFQIKWPDNELSPPANLTRCMAAAREWAEQKAMTQHRKNSVARRLKSLGNFWWSSSNVAQISEAAS